eukprot:14264934-Alexandrium_andersonii.AAC.1
MSPQSSFVWNHLPDTPQSAMPGHEPVEGLQATLLTAQGLAAVDARLDLQDGGRDGKAQGREGLALFQGVAV